MKKLELKVQDISYIGGLINRVTGTLGDHKMAQKIEGKTLLNAIEAKEARLIKLDDNGKEIEEKDEKGNVKEVYDMEKVVKTVEYSDDEMKLLQTTLAKEVADGEEKKISYQAMKPLIILNTLLNEEVENKESEATA